MRPHLIAAALAGAFWLVVVIVLLSGWQPGIYFGLGVAWLLPPIILQLAVGAGVLWQQRRLVALALLSPVIYLAAADSVALSAGTWTIAARQSTGLLLIGVLPVEEALFFLLTNVLIVFGMILMLRADSHILRDRRLFSQLD